MENNIYIRVNEKEQDLLKDIINLLEIDYELSGDFIPVDSLMLVIRDLKGKYGKIEEAYEDLKEDMEENYELKKKDPYEEYGISERDFH